MIERFTENTSEIWRKWSKTSELLSPPGIRLEDVYRKLYTKLAPGEPPLPACWSHKITVVTPRGDGMLETSETLMMPSGEKEYTYELFVANVAYVKTCFSDYDHEDSPWVFKIYAPTIANLDVAIKELTLLLPPMLEIKILDTQVNKKVPASEKTEELKNSSSPKLIMSVMHGAKIDLPAMKEHLEKLPGIKNLNYDFSYNLAECEYDYEEVHFEFKDYHFLVYEDNDAEDYKLNFYVVDGECPEEIINVLGNHCKSLWQK